jgi:hypothetical protein
MGSNSCTTPRFMRQNNFVMSREGYETKNDLAGEDHHQFIRTEWTKGQMDRMDV